MPLPTVSWKITTHNTYTPISPSQCYYDRVNKVWRGISIPTDQNKMYFGGTGNAGSIHLFSDLPELGYLPGSAAWNLYAYNATGFSLVFKIRPQDFVNRSCMIYVSSPTNGIANPNNNMRFYVDTDGHVKGRIGLDSGTVYAVDGGAIPTTSETAVVYTVQSGIFRIYVNGTLMATDGMSFDAYPGPQGVRSRFAFVEAPVNDEYHGYLRPITVYNRILTAPEIASITIGTDTWPTSPAGRVDYADPTLDPTGNWGEIEDIITTSKMSMWAVEPIKWAMFRNGCYLDGLPPGWLHNIYDIDNVNFIKIQNIEKYDIFSVHTLE